MCALSALALRMDQLRMDQGMKDILYKGICREPVGYRAGSLSGAGLYRAGRAWRNRRKLEPVQCLEPVRAALSMVGRTKRTKFAKIALPLLRRAANMLASAALYIRVPRYTKWSAQ